jgi:hypothetical protein
MFIINIISDYISWYFKTIHSIFVLYHRVGTTINYEFLSKKDLNEYSIL